jgi:hypothetical protein
VLWNTMLWSVWNYAQIQMFLCRIRSYRSDGYEDFQWITGSHIPQDSTLHKCLCPCNNSVPKKIITKAIKWFKLQSALPPNSWGHTSVRWQGQKLYVRLSLTQFAWFRLSNAELNLPCLFFGGRGYHVRCYENVIHAYSFKSKILHCNHRYKSVEWNLQNSSNLYSYREESNCLSFKILNSIQCGQKGTCDLCIMFFMWYFELSLYILLSPKNLYKYFL